MINILPEPELLVIFFWMSLKKPRVGIFFIFLPTPGLDSNSRILFQAAADAAGKGLQPHDHLVGDDEPCAVFGLFHQRSTNLNFIERFDLLTWAFMVIFLQSIWQPTVKDIQQVETTVHSGRNLYKARNNFSVKNISWMIFWDFLTSMLARYWVE